MSPARPPVFLLGPARSGTSMLYKALCLHPGAAWISNWTQRYPARPELSVLNRVAPIVPGLQRRIWFGADGANAYVYNGKRAWWERAFPSAVEGETVYAHCDVQEADPAHRSSRQDSLRTTFATMRRFGGGRSLVTKRIANNRRIPLLVDLFPEGRFVSIIRDGRAVAYSLSRVNWWEEDVVWWYGGTPADWAAEGRDPWELCARNWVEEVSELERGLPAVPTGQALTLSYEGFVADPVATLETVAAFAGLGPSRRWEAQIRRLSFPNQNESWRSRLEPSATETIERFQRDTLLRYGYTLAAPAVI